MDSKNICLYCGGDHTSPECNLSAEEKAMLILMSDLQEAAGKIMRYADSVCNESIGITSLMLHIDSEMSYCINNIKERSGT